jgi:hypothetical protein
MADSKKIQGQSEETPTVSEEIILHHENDAPVRIARGKGGRFAKKTREMPSSLEVTRLMRNLLNSAERDDNGNIIKDAQSRFRKMFNAMYRIVTADIEQPVLDKLGHAVLLPDGKPLIFKDAKIAMASVQAFKELMLRAHGAPSKSDAELEAMTTQGVQILIIAPPEMVNKEIKTEQQSEKLIPAFIDAEVVESK